MSRDRLRDIRANQQGGGQPQQSQPSYGGAYAAPQQDYPPQQQYGQQPQQYYQPEPMPMQPMTGGPGGRTADLPGFFAEVASIQDEIKHLHSSINSVSDLHSRRLATTDDALQSESAAQLSALTQSTAALTKAIRDRITKLNAQNKSSQAGDPDFNVRKTQIGGLQNSFKKALEEYNLVEKKSRDKYRQRMERQIRIVKPDATQEEIKAAFDDQDGAQIFSQALVQSRQSGARAAFAEVQNRNQDLRKIEETITSLAQMMQDMATLVLEQDDSVQQIEASANMTKVDVETGLKQTQKAVKSARASRKKRWICFIIVVIILAIVAIVVAVEVTNNQKKT